MFVKSYAKNAGRLTYLINVSYLFLQMVVLVSRRHVSSDKQLEQL